MALTWYFDNKIWPANWFQTLLWQLCSIPSFIQQEWFKLSQKATSYFPAVILKTRFAFGNTFGNTITYRCHNSEVISRNYSQNYSDLTRACWILTCTRCRTLTLTRPHHIPNSYVGVWCLGWVADNWAQNSLNIFNVRDTCWYLR